MVVIESPPMRREEIPSKLSSAGCIPVGHAATVHLRSGGNIPDESGCAPYIRIVPLVPVDKSLPQSDTWDSCPATTETNIVLVVEEVRGISWVQVHCFEAIMGRQRCASPLPKPSKIALSTESFAITGHGRGMPVAKGNVAIVKLDEELVKVSTGMFSTTADGCVRPMARWWCLFHSFVGQMPR